MSSYAEYRQDAIEDKYAENEIRWKDDFVHNLQPGDVVVLRDGRKNIGVGLLKRVQLGSAYGWMVQDVRSYEEWPIADVCLRAMIV